MENIFKKLLGVFVGLLALYFIGFIVVRPIVIIVGQAILGNSKETVSIVDDLGNLIGFLMGAVLCTKIYRYFTK